MTVLNDSQRQWIAGFTGEPFGIEQLLPGGGNNRVFRVSAQGSSPLVLKQYYHSPDDSRDRLRHEFAFSRFAWESGLRNLPCAIAERPGEHLALYEFIEGEKPQAWQVGEQAIQQALDFVLALNRNKTTPAARALPDASESCFSIAQHIERVDQRMSRLEQSLADPNEATQAAADFVAEQLIPEWQRLRTALAKRFQHDASTAILMAEQRCISPSDFGFHNALLRPDGKYCFLDFEYSGWDDPAKLVGDFFSQAAIPAPVSFIHPFVTIFADQFTCPEAVYARTIALLPLYRVKWCCIILNEFIPQGAQRRAFARNVDLDACRIAQLETACRHLNAIETLRNFD